MRGLVESLLARNPPQRCRLESINFFPLVGCAASHGHTPPLAKIELTGLERVACFTWLEVEHASGSAHSQRGRGIPARFDFVA
jgi:hypothetical protein